LIQGALYIRGATMPAHPIYRSIEPADGAAILRIHRRAILLEGVRAYSPAMVRSWAEGMDADYCGRAARSGAVVEVAQLHGAIVGFCGRLGSEIEGLFVDPGFSRQGIGRGLTLRALQRIRAAGHDQAKVVAALSGVGFYEALGFRPVRGLRQATRGGLHVPVLEMARDLGPGPPGPSGGAPGPLSLLQLRSAGAL
jgi:ribosomal protein S18 acetylase RimI-like enzyme